MYKKVFPYILFSLFCSAFALSLLIYHHVPAELSDQAIDFTIYGRLHAVLNYDSPEFLKDAVQPVELLEHDSIRQSRPGLILLVTVLNDMLDPVRDSILPLYRASGKEIHTDEYIPYTLYVLINFFLLFLSFFIYWIILRDDIKNTVLAVVFLGGLLVFNDVVKAFLWTPHTQLFNVLVPLVCLYTLLAIKKHDLFNQRKIFTLAFLAGLGMTAYGTFILFVPTVLLAIMRNIFVHKEKASKKLVTRLILVIALTILPFLVWVVYILAKTGSFYQYEYVQGQFAWIFPLLKSVPVDAGLKVVSNFFHMLRFLAVQAFILPLIVALVVLVTVDHEHDFTNRLLHIKQFPLEALVVSGLFLLFFSLSGLVGSRTAFSGVPPLIVGTAVVVCRLLGDSSILRRRLGNGAVALLVLLQGVTTVIKTGPFN